MMLSDERIRQIAEDIYCSEGTHAEIEHSIRGALAEAAVCSQFKPGESGQVWEPVQVPVVGEPVAWAWNYSGMIVTTDKAKADAIATLADSGEFRQHNVKVRCLYEKPTTSITAQELDALRKDAERYRWLRDPSVYVGKVIDKVAGYEPMTELGTGGYPIYEYRAGSELDEAIDAAIAADGEKE